MYHTGVCPKGVPVLKTPLRAVFAVYRLKNCPFLNSGVHLRERVIYKNVDEFYGAFAALFID
jgi:hypothetical protein